MHPENAVDYAVGIAPVKTVLLDCADFAGEPGEIRTLLEDDVQEALFSTHRFPVQAVARIIHRDTCGEVYLIGIQPEKTVPGTTLSTPVRQSGDRIIEIIRGAGYA